MSITLLNVVGMIAGISCVGILKKKRKWALLEYVFVMLFLGWLIYHMFLNQDVLNSTDPIKGEISATLVAIF